MSVLLIAGSPSEHSRSAALLDSVRQRLRARGAHHIERLQIRDLSPQALLLADTAHRSVARAIDQVARATALVVATPVYLLVRLLEKSGLKLADVTPVYLAPADARAAFESNNVDAWVIWDPFTAAAEKQISARVLADATGVANNHRFYLAERGFAEKHSQVINAVFEDSVDKGQWLKANLRQAAELIAPLQGLPVDVVELALRRYEFNVKPLTDSVIAEQQKIADTFFDLKLIPKGVAVREASWKAAQ